MSFDKISQHTTHPFLNNKNNENKAFFSYLGLLEFLCKAKKIQLNMRLFLTLNTKGQQTLPIIPYLILTGVYQKKPLIFKVMYSFFKKHKGRLG